MSYQKSNTTQQKSATPKIPSPRLYPNKNVTKPRPLPSSSSRPLPSASARPLPSTSEVTARDESAGAPLAPKVAPPPPMMPAPIRMAPFMPNVFRFRPPIAPFFFPNPAPVPVQYVEHCQPQSFAQPQEENYQEMFYPSYLNSESQSYQPQDSHMPLMSGNMQPMLSMNSSNYLPAEGTKSFAQNHGWFPGGSLDSRPPFWKEPVGSDSTFDQQNSGAINSVQPIKLSAPMDVAQVRSSVAVSQVVAMPRGIMTRSIRCLLPKPPEKESVACQAVAAVKDASTTTETVKLVTFGTNTEQPKVKVAEINTEISIPGSKLMWPADDRHPISRRNLRETRLGNTSLESIRGLEQDFETELTGETTVNESHIKTNTQQTCSNDVVRNQPASDYSFPLQKTKASSLEMFPQFQKREGSKKCAKHDSDSDEVYYSDDSSLSGEGTRIKNARSAINSDPRFTLLPHSKSPDRAGLTHALPGRLKSRSSDESSISSEISKLLKQPLPQELSMMNRDFSPQLLGILGSPSSSRPRFPMPVLPCASAPVVQDPSFRARFPECLANASYVNKVLSENSSLTRQIMEMLLRVNPLFALNPVAHQQAAFRELMLVKRYQAEMKLCGEPAREKVKPEKQADRGENVHLNIPLPSASDKSDSTRSSESQSQPSQVQETTPILKEKFENIPLQPVNSKKSDEGQLNIRKNSQPELQQPDARAKQQHSCYSFNDALSDKQKHPVWVSSRKLQKESENEFSFMDCHPSQHDGWISVKSGGWQRWKKMNSSRADQMSLERNAGEMDDWDDKSCHEDMKTDDFNIPVEKVSELCLITLDSASKEAGASSANKDGISENTETTSDKETWHQVCRRKQKRESHSVSKGRYKKSMGKWKKMSGC